jgi:hypothetical protein
MGPVMSLNKNLHLTIRTAYILAQGYSIFPLKAAYMGAHGCLIYTLGPAFSAFGVN